MKIRNKNIKVLVVDNYDSFVYNLVHILYEIGVTHIDVVKNDLVDFQNIKQYDKILLSPGPGVPKDAGLMPQIIDKYATTKSILGVCLGHQAIVEVFGGDLINLEQPLHGVQSAINIQKSDCLFEQMPANFNIGHYHSWIANQFTLPNKIEVIATDSQGSIMAIRHKEHDVRGLQFHPESILTDNGKQIIKNWIDN